MSEQLTEQQKENLRRIVLMARKHIARHIKKADAGEAVGITNRVYEAEKYFRQKGVNLE